MGTERDHVVCTFEAETWSRTLPEGGPPSPANGMVVDVIDHATGEVEQLVRADGEWLPRESA